MLDALLRKGRQIADDPVLRRWLVLWLVGRALGEPPFAAHRPPYLGRESLAAEVPTRGFRDAPEGAPGGAVELPLPGETVALVPGREGALFERVFADTETMLAVHRFAWVPLVGDAVSPGMVVAAWRGWVSRFGKPSDDWPWHPYTAAERVVNLLDFAIRHGLPAPAGETAAVLAAHGPVIAARLEYFGDHHTSNHLANNGRGLYRLGLALGLDRCRDMGLAILVEEARRIFRPTGVLREGSSHYHLLLTRNYLDAWLAARRHERPEEGTLRAVAAAALAVVPRLAVGGGLPLVGDISPDCPPSFLAGLWGGEGGWLARRDPDDTTAVAGLIRSCGVVSSEALAADGWLKAEFGPWSGLWHASPEGWSHMPGHGHQDCGGFELHFGDEPVFVDPGRGAYGDDGPAAFYRSGASHNILTIDGEDPYPANRPYYDDAFRRRVCGPPPSLALEPDGVALRHHGYCRLAKVGAVTRRWRFEGKSLRLSDAVEGAGRHRVRRLLVAVLPVEKNAAGLTLRGRERTYLLRAEGAVDIRPATRWTAYGVGQEATIIDIGLDARLPWASDLTVVAE